MTVTNRLLKMLRDHNGKQKYHPLLALHDLVDEEDCTVSEKIAIYKAELKYTESECKQLELMGSDNIRPINLVMDIPSIKNGIESLD